MTHDEILKKNLDLHAEWMKYVFDHPDVLDEIPKGAVLVILPEDDREMFEVNKKVIEKKKAQGIPIFAVTLKAPKLQITNMEVVSAST